MPTLISKTTSDRPVSMAAESPLLSHKARLPYGGRGDIASSTTIDVRHVTDNDIPEWTRTWSTGYLRTPGEDTADHIREALIGARAIGAFEADRCVGTYRSTTQELTVPGGATLPACTLSKVTVAGTHRRRGLLRRMLDMDMREAGGRGEAVAILDAAEYAIYGRFGFGPAASMAWFTIDVHRAHVDRRQMDDTVGVELVTAAEYRKLASDVYERFRTTQPGALRRDDAWWDQATGLRTSLGSHWVEPYFAVYTSASTGEVDGFVCFTAEEAWQAMQPHSPLLVKDLIALNPAAERALTRYVVKVDWVSTVHLPCRAPDTLAPRWLGDPRAARVTALSDYLWLRILDVPRALSARTYAVDGSLVLKIKDADGYGEGTWLLDGGPQGATCVPTTRPADIVLGVDALAALYLGDDSFTRLAALTSIEEERAGALAVADAMFRTARRPWSPRAATHPEARPC
ncbi:GNAT family N-acetyltransferase [Streptomyces sp. NBC_00237]|uniref:GNAT family N-acetyltransferase n=1 Tax=Streptomyces sp. NBC_00237 TaxID=2975687 RepID=UPI0022593076|nr:GNAT family N-acetyltransferase [Streptomyces sp. NBC_00237]MCX5206709.1 GNAT family N-acetyltransferase [Streptomyces sp. NBC_00237]